MSSFVRFLLLRLGFESKHNAPLAAAMPHVGNAHSARIRDKSPRCARCPFRSRNKSHRLVPPPRERNSASSSDAKLFAPPHPILLQCAERHLMNRSPEWSASPSCKAFRSWNFGKQPEEIVIRRCGHGLRRGTFDRRQMRKCLDNKGRLIGFATVRNRRQIG